MSNPFDMSAPASASGPDSVSSASAPLQAQNGNAQQPLAKPPSFLQKKGLLGGQGKGSIVSPTDNVLSPCSAKLSGAKQRHFAKGKPVGIASQLSQLAAQSQRSQSHAGGEQKDQPKVDF